MSELKNMDVDDLKKICQERAKLGYKTDSVDDRLLLSIPEPKRHNGYRVRLFQNRGPIATVINGHHGRLTVYVSANRLLKFIEKQGESNG